MEKVRPKDLAAFRIKLLADQGGKCAITGQKLTPDTAVVDHCHRTGEIRGVLHRGVNTLLGNLENNRARAGLSDDVLFAKFLKGVLQYLHTARTGVLYPTHKTEEEKRVARNKRARARRAASKTGGSS